MTQLLLALALGASTTKLGGYFAGSLDPASTLLAGPGCPAVAVFPLPGDTAAGAQVATLRAACPQTAVVFQVGGNGVAYGALPPPLTAWQTSWFQEVAGAGARSGDWVEGPTEISGGTSTQLGDFWTGFAQAVSGSSYRPVVGGLAAGAPPTAVAPDGGTENILCETLRRMPTATVGGTWAWSYHALTPTLDQSTSNIALGYGAIAQECMANGAPNATVILTQAGRSAGTWQTADMTWLGWFDRQLGQDATVLGAALFEAGGTDRSLSPISGQLAAYLQNPSVPDGGADGGSDGGGGTGGATTAGGTGAVGGLGSPPPSSSCATAGAGAAALVALAPLLLRRRRQGVKR